MPVMNSILRVARRLAVVLPVFLLVAHAASAQEAERPASLHAQGETPWIYENSNVPRDDEWLFGKLDNGLRYGVRYNGVPPGQVSIRVRIDAGSLHEEDNERGYAHLLEHLLFRESRYLGISEAIPTWQRLGASFGSDTNAETTPTHTAYKLDLPDVNPAKFEESMRLLSGMIRGPVLSDANVSAEVPIVLAEKRERGGVSERIGEQTLQTLFAGQRLAERIIIGTEDSLQSANGASVQAFYDRWYRPENTVISVAGDLDPVLFAAMIEKYFADWEGTGPRVPAPDFGDPVAPAGSDPANPVGEVAVIVEPSQPRSLTYGFFKPWRQVEDTIDYNIGWNREVLALSLINRRLEARARKGGSYLQAQASASKISRSSRATLVQISPLTDDWEAAVADVRAVIADALANPPTRDEMKLELQRLEVIFGNEVEQRTNRPAASYANDLVTAVDIRESVAAPETFLMVFNLMKDSSTPENVLAMTRELFSGNVIRATYVTPEAGEASENELRAALSAPVTADADARAAKQTITFADLPAIGEPGEVVARVPHGLGNVERVEYGNGVKALLLSNDGEPGRVAVRVRFGAGLRAFDPDDAVYVDLGESTMFALGLGNLGLEEIDRLTTGRKIGFDFTVREGSFLFEAETRKQDLDDQLYLFAAKLGMPRWDEHPFTRAKASAQLGYDSYGANPDGVLGRDLDYHLYNRNPLLLTADPSMLETATLEGLRAVWEPLLRQGDIEVMVFGDFDLEETVKVLSRTFGALPDREPIAPEVLARGLTVSSPGETVVRTHSGEANQAAAVVAWPAGAGFGEIRRSRQLTILTEVFNNRLMDAMREKAGASYSPSMRLDWPTDVESGGSILGYAQLQPEDVPLYFAEADRIARDLTFTPPSADELARATEPLRNYYQRIASGQYFYMLELEGSTSDRRRMEALRGLINDYAQTTPEAMLNLARKYLAKPAWRMAVIPEGQELATDTVAPVRQSGR